MLRHTIAQLKKQSSKLKWIQVAMHKASPYSPGHHLWMRMASLQCKGQAASPQSAGLRAALAGTVPGQHIKRDIQKWVRQHLHTYPFFDGFIW